MLSLAEEQSRFTARFENWLQGYLQLQSLNSDYAANLLQSQSYSLLSGGKRFRPFLAEAVYQLFGGSSDATRSYCLSLEMVHTYSLIHDDLPCMDNDDFRRGQPTNHKKFSEEIALLAGDGLLTDAFFLLSSDTQLPPSVRLQLIELLSSRAGSAGMVSGQIFDMQVSSAIDLKKLQQIHRLKTAHLIQAAAVGGALIAEATGHELEIINNFGFHLGMAFQIQDDLLDADDQDQSYKSYLSLLGLPGASSELQKHSDQALSSLAILKRPKTSLLEELVRYNLKRLI